MTIWCGGMLRSITRNAPAIAVAVTAIVIEGQWFSIKCLADIGPARLLPTLRRGDRELRKLSHDRRLARSYDVRFTPQKRTSPSAIRVSRFVPKADISKNCCRSTIGLFGATKAPFCGPDRQIELEQRSVLAV